MEWSIPLPTKDETLITQSVSLDGRSYVFTFDWNSRIDRWSFSMDTEDGFSILRGALLVAGIDLLRTIPRTLSYVPTGMLYLGGAGDPTRESIDAVTLFYISEDA